MTDRDADNPIIRLVSCPSRLRPPHGPRRPDLRYRSRTSWVFISGPSGAGKTTLLKLLYCGTRASAGRGRSSTASPWTHLRRDRVPQLRRACWCHFPGLQADPRPDRLRERRPRAGGRPATSAASSPSKVRAVLRMVGMEGHADTLPPRLSGGEQQRAAVARAIVGDPKIILADEPTGSLDEDSARAVLALLQAAHIRGATVIIATHDKAHRSAASGGGCCT
ncbi:MAG: ATP-binding cassette domain-containing protein [Desulfobacterales bacterium]|nr:ATP-binding cassette domain-containing protein [Desulfobacterales bacterium]